MIRILALCGVLAAFPLCGAAQETMPEAPPEAFELVFIRDTGPVLLRIQARLGSESVQARFQTFLKKWFDFLDRDGDGKLNAKELIGAPKATTMAQILRAGAFFQGQPNVYLNLADLRKGTGEAAGLDDFIGYYRRNNIQALQITPSFRGAQFADQPGEALFKLLDTDKDGKLARGEVAAAATLLRRFDLNDDELVAATELVPTDVNGLMRVQAIQALQGRQPANTFGMSFYPLINAGDRDRLPLILLSHFDKDENTRLNRAESGFDAKTFERLDKNKDGELDVEELAPWLTGPADLEFDFQLPESGGGMTLNLHKAAARFKSSHSWASPISALIKLSDVEITVQGRDIGTSIRANTGRQFLEQLFRQADKDERGYLEVFDLQGGQLVLLRTLFPIADRDGDGKLTLHELTAYNALQSEAPRCQAALAVVEQGRALFQLFDANRDGQLSIHELRSAWVRLEPLDEGKTGFITVNQIARQFQILVAQGPAQNFVTLGAQALQGRDFRPGNVSLPGSVPAWFRKMDINADGFISPREFLGNRADFTRIDSSGDGLLDPQEGERFDALVRGKN